MTGSEVLVLEGVSVTYADRGRGGASVEALRDVSLCISPGEVVALVGANGAGKTTLLELAVGAILPTVGSITILGERTSAHIRRRSIGFAPDLPAFPQSLRGNELLELIVGLNGIAPDLAGEVIRRVTGPLGLDAVLRQRVDALSRGNMQKLGIVQALIREPVLLLCDEPFGSLDPVVQAGLRTVLRAEAERGAAVVVSSHQLDQIARIADRVLVLDRGKLILDCAANSLPASLEAILLNATSGA